MAGIDIQLVTAEGDEIGRLLLADIALTAPGEAGTSPLRSQLRAQMDALLERIMAALSQEKMSLTLDPLSTRIAISRALMAENTADPILIPLTVQEKSRLSADSPQPRQASGSQATPSERSAQEQPRRSASEAQNWDEFFPPEIISPATDMKARPESFLGDHSVGDHSAGETRREAD